MRDSAHSGQEIALNCSQKVIKSLALAKRPMTKLELQDITKFSIHTLHETMTVLKRSDLIAEVQGKYMVTPKGHELYTADTTLQFLAFNLVKHTNGTKTETIDLNWDNLRRWYMVKYILDNQDDWAKETRVTEAAEIFTLLGAIQAGQRFKPQQVDDKNFPGEIAEKMKTILQLLEEVTEWMNSFDPR
jgi:hypothetical protein